jgi:hypothetical protein
MAKQKLESTILEETIWDCSGITEEALVEAGFSKEEIEEAKWYIEETKGELCL